MKILIYADLDLRLIDGSSTWLASLAEVLSAGGHQVQLLSKVRFSESRVLDRLLGRYPDIGLDIPEEENSPLDPNGAAARASQLQEQHDFDLIIVRGFNACVAFSKHEDLSPNLWSYITDLPFPVDELSKYQSERLEQVASRSRRMFAQTEAARSYLEAVAPSASGRTLLLPPMVPDEAYESDFSTIGSGTPLRLIYAGKLAKQWHTREMLALPDALRDRGVDAELVVVGDKFQHDVDAPAWVDDMRTALIAAEEDENSRVTWLGGLARNEVLKQLSRAHIGIGWRSSVLDSSLEVSTKALEYAASSTLPLLNLSADHLSLWGEEYPLLVSSEDSVDDVADCIVEAMPKLADAVASARSTAFEFSMDAAATRLDRQLVRSARKTPSGCAPTKIVISSHDFKFLGELVDGLKQQPDFELAFDGWTSLHNHDEASSIEIKSDADVVFCEWAGPSLVWHAANKSPSTKLIARLHGFELRGAWLDDLLVDAVDQWVFVSDRYRRMAIDQLQLDEGKTSIIPNMVDADDLNRPKLAGSEFQLGMVGIVGFGKRPDRALDLLETLLEHDDRYMLRFKSRPPWDYAHEWQNPLQRQLYLDFYTRIRNSELLKSHIAFEAFSPDIASWLRGVGFVLSPSHNESFHLAPVEGMASGAVPIVWQREGAEEIFGKDWIVGDTHEAAEKILGLNRSFEFSAASSRAREQSLRWDRDRVLQQWFEILGEG
ncbi:glycosyl transferase [Brevibacterium sp. ZH18]|uniref:glycosyl transferase n=1 Tax=Brevibacterium sp. ZH18 TaxID=2927784 RepID=UPI001F60DADC|nr:glycosyl transferase [Brevibacterium sp. ZH18]MCI4011734.1 glycosyl transferase [Brevibacterium sp. ZH18]